MSAAAPSHQTLLTDIALRFLHRNHRNANITHAQVLSMTTDEVLDVLAPRSNGNLYFTEQPPSSRERERINREVEFPAVVEASCAKHRRGRQKKSTNGVKAFASKACDQIPIAHEPSARDSSLKLLVTHCGPIQVQNYELAKCVRQLRYEIQREFFCMLNEADLENCIAVGRNDMTGRDGRLPDFIAKLAAKHSDKVLSEYLITVPPSSPTVATASVSGNFMFDDEFDT